MENTDIYVELQGGNITATKFVDKLNTEQWVYYLKNERIILDKYIKLSRETTKHKHKVSFMYDRIFVNRSHIKDPNKVPKDQLVEDAVRKRYADSLSFHLKY